MKYLENFRASPLSYFTDNKRNAVSVQHENTGHTSYHNPDQQPWGSETHGTRTVLTEAPTAGAILQKGKGASIRN